MEGFEIIGALRAIQTIAIGRSIRELARLPRTYGRGHWRERKGTVRLADGFVCEAEVHWYEAAGIGFVNGMQREGKVDRTKAKAIPQLKVFAHRRWTT